MDQAAERFDILVVGSHPAAAVAAAVARAAGRSVARVNVPAEKIADRLAYASAELFKLDPVVSPLLQNIQKSPVHGLRFLPNDASTAGEYLQPQPAGYTVSLADFTKAADRLAGGAGVPRHTTTLLQPRAIDEQGVQLELDHGRRLSAAVLLVGTVLPRETRRVLNLALEWEAGALWRVSWLELPAKQFQMPANQTIPISLDLSGKGHWAYAHSLQDRVQLSILQPATGAVTPAVLMEAWLTVLRAHGVATTAKVQPAAVESADLPLAGALG